MIIVPVMLGWDFPIVSPQVRRKEETSVGVWTSIANLTSGPIGQVEIEGHGLAHDVARFGDVHEAHRYCARSES
jgi:hypothetical protein